MMDEMGWRITSSGVLVGNLGGLGPRPAEVLGSLGLQHVDMEAEGNRKDAGPL